MRSASAVATAIALGTREPTRVRSAKGTQSRRCPKEAWRFVTLKKTGPRTVGAQDFNSIPSASGASSAQREASEGVSSLNPPRSGPWCLRSSFAVAAGEGTTAEHRSNCASGKEFILRLQHCAGRVMPNPSFKRSAAGRPPGPGRRYAVHCRQPGPGVLPSSPA